MASATDPACTDLVTLRFEAPAGRALAVAALGEPLIEFNQTDPAEPRYLRGFGGDTSNAAIAAARAGAAVAYLSRVGSDAFGDALLALWEREGVAPSAVERDAQAATGIYFVSHGPKGHEFTYLRAGSAAARITPEWLAGAPAQQIARAQWLHVSGISMAISPSACDTVLAAMALAREHCTRVSLDSNLRLRLWPLARARACLSEALTLADLFLPSTEDLAQLTGLHEASAQADWAHAHGAACVVLKLGAEGCLLSLAPGGTGSAPQRLHLPGHPATLVDATGAGDCFCGHLLARLAAGDTLVDAARWANAAASLAVQGFGAVDPLPTAAQVRARLAATP